MAHDSYAIVLLPLRLISRDNVIALEYDLKVFGMAFTSFRSSIWISKEPKIKIKSMKMY